MADFLMEHPYLFANLITFGAVHLVACFFLNPLQNRAIIVSGLINLTCFPFLVFLENEYWNPVRVGGGSLGFEDALCSYDVAALLWLVLSFGVTISRDFRFDWKRLIRRFLSLGLGISLVFIAGCLWGLRGMTSLVVTQAVILPFLFFLSPKTLRLALRGVLLYPLVYFVIVKFYFLIWPDFVRQWNLEGPWGTVIMGVPLGEFAWSVGFALWWPPFFAYLCNLDLRRNSHGAWLLVPAGESENT